MGKRNSLFTGIYGSVFISESKIFGGIISMAQRTAFSDLESRVPICDAGDSSRLFDKKKTCL